jgi:hypothetical protein
LKEKSEMNKEDRQRIHRLRSAVSYIEMSKKDRRRFERLLDLVDGSLPQIIDSEVVLLGIRSKKRGFYQRKVGRDPLPVTGHIGRMICYDKEAVWAYLGRLHILEKIESEIEEIELEELRKNAE